MENEVETGCTKRFIGQCVNIAVLASLHNFKKGTNGMVLDSWYKHWVPQIRLQVILVSNLASTRTPWISPMIGPNDDS